MSKKSETAVVVLDRVGDEELPAKPIHFNTGRDNKRAGRNPLPTEKDRFSFELEKGHEGLYRVVMYRLNHESRRYRPIFEGEFRERIGALAELYNIYACGLVDGMAKQYESR